MKIYLNVRYNNYICKYQAENAKCHVPLLLIFAKKTDIINAPCEKNETDSSSW